jgi:hypothetical protein
MPEPQRSRAVFSSEDFELLRTAVMHYLKESSGQDPPPGDRGDLVKFANLYHRLGRIG